MTKARVHTREQISAFLTELEKQTDRGAALIAAAVLDEILEMLITARLLDVGRDHHDALFGRGKPLDSFSAKIELGYALGLYSNPARIQLEMIREVRNKFAHRIEPLEFTNPDIVKAVTSRQLPSTPKGLTTRNQFLGVFSMVAALLYGTAGADIRILSLGESHPEHFLKMARAIMAMQEGEPGKKPPALDSEP